MHVKTNFSVSDALKYVKMLKKMESGGLKTHTLPGEGKYIGDVSYFVHEPAATKKLVLEQFGYPEEEAKAWRKAQAEQAKAGGQAQNE